jgi:hypothetical protein
MAQTELTFPALEKEVTKLTKKKAKPKTNKLSQEDYDLLEFKRIINQSPPDKLLKKNSQYGNSYIPFPVVKQMLLAIFDSYGTSIPCQPLYAEGQITYFVHLTVTHPVLKTRETYSGTASVPLIPASGDFKWNHRSIPAGESFAILNAAKKIGRIFQVNEDDFSDVMAEYFEKKINDSEESPEVLRLFGLIERAKSYNALVKVLIPVEIQNNRGLNIAYDKKLETFKK